MEGFLHLISRDIRKLQSAALRRTIAAKGIFETGTAAYTETYKLTKRTDYGYDQFEYSIKVRE